MMRARDVFQKRNHRRRPRIGRGAAFFLLGFLSAPVLAQAPSLRANVELAPIAEEAPVKATEAGPAPVDAGGNVEAPSPRDTPGGMLVPSIFRATGASFPSVRSPGDYGEPAKTADAEGNLTLSMPHFNVGLPLRRAFEPQDADLKLGPVYFRVNDLRVGFLHSDNVNLTETGRQSGWIGIVQLDGAVFAQLTEGLQLAASGALIYLPLESRGGVAGFGALPLELGYGILPALAAQLSLTSKLFGWEIVFADDFRTRIGSYTGTLRDDPTAFEVENSDLVSRAGRYEFGIPRRNRDNSTVLTSRQGSADFMFFSNTLSAATTHVFPNEVRLNGRVLHEDIWYNSGGRGLPSLRDEATLQAIWDKENLRFKPYVQYDAARTDQTPGIDQEVRAGVFGPITQNLFFDGNVGEFFPSGNRGTRLVWKLQLNHQAGPYTAQSIAYSRSVSDLHDQIAQYVSYNLRQIFGPTLVGDFFAVYRKGEELLADVAAADTEYRLGARLTFQPGARTQFRNSLTYGRISDNRGNHADVYTARSEVSRYVSDSINLRVLYQYQQRDTNFPGGGYFENLFLFIITKYFH